MKEQHDRATKALSQAYNEEHSQFKPRWENESGTAIMKDMLTNERFYAGNQDWMFLFCLCALKMPCESVVESMGKIVADHADPSRGCEIENYTKEAVVHWNAPPPAKAKLFLIKALKHRFGDNWRTAFVHASERDHHGRKRTAFMKSDVVERELGKKARLSFMAE